MFWRFGFQNPSAIDALLDREDIELEDILEEEDLLQEAKSHNQKLVDFLCRPENLEKLLNYITATDLDESRRFKYPFLSCEIIACEIPQIVDAIVLERKELLESFWSFLDRPAPPRRRADDQGQTQPKENEEGEEGEHDKLVGLDSLQAQYFCKTISVFLTKRTAEVLEFIRAKPENLDRILAHLQTTAIMDLLLTLVRVEELPEGKGIVQWLSDHGLLDSLIERLDPYLDSEEHSVAQQCISEIIRISQTSLVESPSIGLNHLIINLKSERVIRKLTNYMLDAKAPNSTSTLINGVTIIIDLIRHNNSDMDSDPMLNGAYGYSNTMVRQTSVSLADMLRVLADHVGDFNSLLIHPRSVSTPMKTTLGEQIPLGFERLKICELFAELLHCSNMTNLNTISDDEVSEQIEGATTEEKTADAQEEKEQEEKATTIEEEEKQPSADSKQPSSGGSGETAVQKEEKERKESQQVVDATSTSETEKGDEVEEEGEKESEPVVTLERDGSKVTIGDYLKIQFVEHRVMPTCIDLFFAFPWNNFLHYVIYDMLHQVFNGRMDKGYNRHLAISVFKDGKLTDRMVAAQKENDEECAKPKGMRLGYMGHLTFIADEIIKLFEGYPETIVNYIKDDIDLQSWNEYCANQLRETKERDRLPLAGPRPNDGMDAATDEDEEEETLEGTAASPYSRYLAQHADGGLDDDEDEETENWITGRDDYDREYSYGGAFGADHIAAHRINSTQDELDEDEEYGSDDDEESGRMPADWSRGFAPFPQTNMLHRTQSHLHEIEDEGANDGEFFEGNTRAGLQVEDEDDPFGDFTSSEDQGNNQEWSNSFADQFESIRISDSNTTATTPQQSQQQQQQQTQKSDQSIKNEQDYVRAVKTKEEQDAKLAKEYSPEEEQQGEI